MKKKEIIESGMMILIFFGILALLDYFIPGLDGDTRLLTIFIIAVLLIPVAIKLFPSESEEETGEQVPFLIDLISWFITFTFKDIVESKLGLIDTFPLFTEERLFDGRAILSFLIFLVILISSHTLVRKIYFFIKKKLEDRRALLKKKMYKNKKYYE